MAQLHPVAEHQHQKRLGYGTAALAAVAALLGSLIGGAFTLWGGRQQIEAQYDQERTVFLRQERNTAYALMLRTDQNLRAWEFSQLEVVLKQAIYTQAEQDKYWAEVFRQQTRLQVAANQVSLVGRVTSPRVV